MGKIFIREILDQVERQLARNKSVMLLGPRQVGKTTLAKSLSFDLEINLAKARERQAYELDPSLLAAKIETLYSEKSKRKTLRIYIDEIQLVPELLSEVQAIIDEKKAVFLLTGSSARKMRHDFKTNLIPGRVVNFRLDGFSLDEFQQDIDVVLEFGQLPEIVLIDQEKQKSLALRSYVENYLEEEIRKETRLRNISNFARFIELAAIQSGEISNFAQISKELGPTIATIQSYYQILEDTLFVDRVDPYLKNATRKKLTKSSRYLFYDLGVRRVAAREGRSFAPERKGKLFEHLVGNEILKWIRASGIEANLYFWRDPDGPEVDWLIESGSKLLPVEVKLAKKIENSHVSHLKTFMTEYSKAKAGIVVNPTDLLYSFGDSIKVVGIYKLKKYLDTFFGVK